jgi:hypothetical protein
MNDTAAAPGALERAILQTILYSDLFAYALTFDEVAHYLIGLTGTVAAIRACLARSSWLAERIVEREGYLVVRGREALIAQRRDRAATSDRLWRHARRFVRVLRVLPFVRMIALTGSLAMKNSSANDDIDVFIVTAADRVWLARACAIALVYTGKLVGVTLCPNYVISEHALVLEKRTLFVAHELMQMVPMYGFAVYEQICAANSWVQALLPNAASPLWLEPEETPGWAGQRFKQFLEKVLSGRGGAALENWEMQRKIRKFQSRLGQPDSDVIIDRDHVKGHFADYGGPLMRLYAERLGQFET